MKKIVKYFVFISLIIFATASSCKKPKDTGEELPTGVNTMYFYVDGKLHIPKDSNIGGISIAAISCQNCLNGNLVLRADILNIGFYQGINNTGSVTLNQSHYDACQVQDNHAFLHGQKELGNDGIYHNIVYYTHDGSGTVNITYLSADKKHFKGTFEMTVYHENTGVEKHITDGHFDINLNTLNQ